MADLYDLLMRYESEGVDEDEYVELFQRLLDSGWIYHLQGRYQREAQDLLNAGLIVPPGRKP